LVSVRLHISTTIFGHRVFWRFCSAYIWRIQKSSGPTKEPYWWTCYLWNYWRYLLSTAVYAHVGRSCCSCGHSNSSHACHEDPSSSWWCHVLDRSNRQSKDSCTWLPVCHCPGWTRRIGYVSGCTSGKQYTPNSQVSGVLVVNEGGFKEHRWLSLWGCICKIRT
jgi:hypothetical protein